MISLRKLYRLQREVGMAVCLMLDQGNLVWDVNLCDLRELHFDLRECVIDCNYNQQEFGLFLMAKEH
ncbi:unnamed protein product (macronuclear) [Paramecium tetraurelia]|uniref:Uncharacterized protein n=1 Tax=Paramecium tetraurelia TaxID=5888 RepID=A0BTI6_PARTE|nr:uncharacterized protein GSPATT00032085001 [Paramecium tetraurelia]CAK61853.1 unnamed protein product [Paramecium tetraurelia]|eukprot:XP_001429251.1 hypothetical protein (macronuclear) [Paramecium tetraurelia strain d4-2]